MKKGIRIAFLILMGIVLLFIFDFICIWIFNKPFFAIKKDNNDSVNLVYSGLLYDTYICHEHSVPQIKIKGTKFTCAYIGVKEMNESVYIPTEVKNVSMSISSLSLTGATIIIKDTNKNPYTYGEWYMIERKVNGKWYEVLPIIENYGFNSIGYLPNENNEVKFIIDWEWLYGKLSYGSYRILKEVGSYYISLEFEISEAVDKKIEVIKPEFRNDIKFNDYLVLDNRTIYLAGNILYRVWKENNVKRLYN